MASSSGLLRWLQRKKYQFEVTLPMYMMTPRENFVLCSFLFIFLSMIVIAIAVYLPEHVTTIFSRAWFYYAGDESNSMTGHNTKRGGQIIESQNFAAQHIPPSQEQRILDTLGTI